MLALLSTLTAGCLTAAAAVATNYYRHHSGAHLDPAAPPEVVDWCRRAGG